MDTLGGGSEGFMSDEDIVQETQAPMSSQQDLAQLCYGQRLEEGLGFEDHMAQCEHGARRRYRNQAPTLHVNSTSIANQPTHGMSERGRRSSLRGSSPLVIQGTSQTDFSSEGGGAHHLERPRNAPRGTQEGTCTTTRKAANKRNGNWTNAQLRRAMDAITDQGMKVRTAARTFGVPNTSLRDHLYGKTIGRRRGVKPTLQHDEEEKLVDYLFKMQDLGHPLTPLQLRLKVAQATQTRETPWSAGGVPGRSWLRNFKHRHPELATRKSQPLEVARARGLCQSTVSSLYHNLEDLYTTFNYPPSHIWNCDESGVQAGRGGGATVLAKVGSKSVHTIEPDQREHLSVLSCINANGGKIPNFYILKGTYFLKDYVRDCEKDVVMAMQPNAWMTKWLFQSWISHFIASLKKTAGIHKENRHLRILDGHNSHVTLEVVTLAMKEGLDMVTLPAHTSHALQPLDVSCFKPFKSAFRKIRDAWTLENKGKKVEKADLCQWTAEALDKALTAKNIKSGFRKTGIWPLDKEVVTSSLLPSEGFENGGGEGHLEEELTESEDSGSEGGCESDSEQCRAGPSGNRNRGE